MKNLKKAIRQFKVQDSADPERLCKTLEEVGFNTNGCVSSFYLLGNENACPITAEIYGACHNDEISAEELYNAVKEIEATKSCFVAGEYVTCVTPEGLKLTFIFIEDFNATYVLGHGQLKSGDISNSPCRYTKKYCRKANVAEIAHFKKVVKDQGYRIEATDGIACLVPFRQIDNWYFTIVNTVSEGVLTQTVARLVDMDDSLARHNYHTGNYFLSEEDAKKVLNSAKSM